MIDMCPHCKKRAGFVWHWSKSLTENDGWQSCAGCDKKI